MFQMNSFFGNTLKKYILDSIHDEKKVSELLLMCSANQTIDDTLLDKIFSMKDFKKWILEWAVKIGLSGSGNHLKFIKEVVDDVYNTRFPQAEPEKSENDEKSEEKEVSVKGKKRPAQPKKNANEEQAPKKRKRAAPKIEQNSNSDETKKEKGKNQQLPSKKRKLQLKNDDDAALATADVSAPVGDVLAPADGIAPAGDASSASVGDADATASPSLQPICEEDYLVLSVSNEDSFSD